MTGTGTPVSHRNWASARPASPTKPWTINAAIIALRTITTTFALLTRPLLSAGQSEPKPNPRDKTPAYGWDAVKKGWETAFAFWSDFKVTRAGEVHVHATPSVAWSSSTADVQGRTKDDKPLSFKVIQTDVFEKWGDRWLLVSHHASPIPD